MKKAMLTILLCGVMVLGITGCGNKSKDFTDEEKAQMVREIEIQVEREKFSQNVSESANLKYNSYEASVTNIEYDYQNLSVVFSGKITIQYPDGKIRNTTFNGTSDIRPNPVALYNTNIEYE